MGRDRPRRIPERERDEDGLPIYKVFQAKAKWLRDERGRLLVQLTTSGEGWVPPAWKMLHQLRMLPELALAIGETLMWIGEEAMHERDCKPKGITDCIHVQHRGDLQGAITRDKANERRAVKEFGSPDTAA